MKSPQGLPGSLGLATAFCMALGLPVQAGRLDVTFAEITRDSNINLTTEGTLDWVHWGLYTETSVDRKAGVVPQISDFELLYDTNNPSAWAFAWQLTDHYNGFGWSDGTPTMSAADTRTGIWAYGIPNLGSGFKLTVPANTTVKTFKVYVGVYSGSGTFTAALSDNSARAFTNGPTSTLVNLGNGPGAVYTVTFAANSPGQVLTVTWTLKTVAGPGASQANVTLESAALSMSGANNPPIVFLTAPAQNNQFAAGTDISITAQAADPDGSVSQVEFYQGANKLGQAASVPYTITWNNVPAGFHTLTAMATDNQGATTVSAPVEIFVYTGGGALAGRRDLSPTTLNLTTQGSLDWAHWGLQTSNSVNRKAAVTPQIGGVTLLGSAPLQRYTNNLTAFAWSDGTPVTSVDGSATGIFMTGLDGGFELLVPAGTSTNQVKVYVGLYGGQSEFQAYLSDFSAAAFADSSVSNVYGNSCAVYTLDYRSASPGQTLTIRHRASRLFDLSYGNMTWQAVTLSSGGPPPPAPVVLLTPALNGSRFGFSFVTELGRKYAAQFTDVLGSNWQTFTNVDGTGGPVAVSQSRAGIAHRFYRVATQ